MATSGEPTAHQPHGGVGHEKRDIRFRPLIIAVLSLALAWGLVYALAWLVIEQFGAREVRQSPPPNVLAQKLGPKVPPAPRLQTNPRADLLQMRFEENVVLDSYGWVDRNAGIVHIPIERAMDLAAAGQRPTSTAPANGPGAEMGVPPNAPAAEQSRAAEGAQAGAAAGSAAAAPAEGKAK